MSDHAPMVRHGQVHGRFSSPFSRQNEIDHVTMRLLTTIYTHDVDEKQHGQHGHYYNYMLISSRYLLRAFLLPDHVADHVVTMPDHVFPNIVEVIHSVAV